MGCTIDERYVIEGIIGEGGMGVVYQCRHKLIGRRCAIKILRAELARDAEVTDRFLTEARAASAIDNEHIIDIFDFGQLPDGSAYFVMELLDGTPLAQIAGGGRAMPAPRITRIALQLAEALGAAHRAGVVHRDVKPDNIFLLPRGATPDFVKVLDFGIAKVSRAGADRWTQLGSVFGTPHYMSPEQAAGTPLDQRADIYSLGVILYELATGRVPFDADNFVGILSQQLYQEPLPPREAAPDVDIPAELERIILRCLEKLPERRYSSTSELQRDLLGMREGLGPVLDPARERDADSGQSSSSRDRETVLPSAPLPSRVPRGARLRPQTLMRRLALTMRRLFVSSARANDVEWAHADELQTILPQDMREHTEELLSFLQTMFRVVDVREQGVVSLREPKIPGVDDCDYFAVFTGASGEIGSATFLNSVRPLESYLAKLSRDKRKMVVAVSYAEELGPGVADQMMDYLREFNARVVPMHVREIVQARASNTTEALFRERLTEFELPNLFRCDGTPAPTSLAGIREAANSFVLALKTPGTILSVYGLPGSGKTSLLRMAAFGLRDREMLTISCKTVTERSVAALVTEMARSLAAYLGREGALVSPCASGREFEDWLSMQVPPGYRLPVIVLEDADWVVDLLSTKDVARREQGREFWTSIARSAEHLGLSVVITSVRGSILGDRIIQDWENPLVSSRLKAWPVPFLKPEDVHRVVKRLAAQMDVAFSTRALKAVAHQSGGHMGVVMQICAQAVEDRRRSPGHPMSTLKIDERQIHRATAHLAAMGPTFRQRLFAWYSDVERRVVQVIASRTIRELNPLRDALPDLEPQAVTVAFERVLETHIIDYQQSAYRLRIPLFRDWVRRHVDRSPDEPKRLRLRKLSILSVGATVSALIATFSFPYLDSLLVQSPALLASGCVYQLVHPRKVTIGEPFDLKVVRTDCSGPEAPRDLILHSQAGTILVGPDPIAIVLSGNQRYASGDVQLSVKGGPLDSVGITLASAEAEIGTVVIPRDLLSELQGKLPSALPVPFTLLLVIAVFLAFNRKLLSALERLVDVLRPLRK